MFLRTKSRHFNGGWWLIYMPHVLVLTVLAYMLLLFQPRTLNVDFPIGLWYRQFALFISWVSIFYLNSLWSVPQFLMRRRFMPYFLVSVLFFLLPLGIFSYFEHYLDIAEKVEKVAFPHGRPYGNYLDKTFLVAAANILVLGLSTSISVLMNGFRSRFNEEQLKAENARVELELLKGQINPHFLLNTLHSIYALIEKEEPDRAQDGIYRLSNMLKTLLYQKGNEPIALEKELQFISDYVNIMHMRTSHKNTVELDVDIENQSLQIAPMLFLPFIENAFKHGMSNIQPSYLFINICQRENTVVLAVRNSLHQSGTRTGSDEEGGIGISNTLRRLELLYEGRFQVDTAVDKENKEYSVTIKINTAKE